MPDDDSWEAIGLSGPHVEKLMEEWRRKIQRRLELGVPEKIARELGMWWRVADAAAEEKPYRARTFRRAIKVAHAAAAKLENALAGLQNAEKERPINELMREEAAKIRIFVTAYNSIEGVTKGQMPPEDPPSEDAPRIANAIVAASAIRTTLAALLAEHPVRSGMPRTANLDVEIMLVKAGMPLRAIVRLLEEEGRGGVYNTTEALRQRLKRALGGSLPATAETDESKGK